MNDAGDSLLLVEKQIIKQCHPLFKDLNDLCFKSKNLYNATLYTVRQQYFKDKSYLDAYSIISQFTKENQPDFRALPAKVSRYTIQLVHQNMKSFFALLKLKEKGQYNKSVRLPKYLDVKDGKQVVHYHKQALSFKEKGLIKLSKSTIKFPSSVSNESVQYVKVVHCGNHIKLLVGYYKKKLPLKKKKNRYASIDVGQNNLMTVTSNVFTPVIYNGKPVKSINQYYNKILQHEQSRLKKRHNCYYSRKLEQLTLWRENQLNNYFHKVTKYFVNTCIAHDIDTVIIGRNKGMKTGISLGKKTNQNFVGIPFTLLYNQLRYKLDLAGITYIETEESYTSKCSFLDKEDICHHDTYLGKRVRRGLFRSKNPKKYNADINGSLNIIRKYLTHEQDYSDCLHDSLRSHMVNPIVLTVS